MTEAENVSGFLNLPKLQKKNNLRKNSILNHCSTVYIIIIILDNIKFSFVSIFDSLNYFLISLLP